MELLRWDVIQSYLPLYRDAMFLTLRIGWAGIFAAVGLGFVCALVRHFRVPILQNIVGIYIELFRNTPLALRRSGTGPFGRRLHGGDFPERP